jgi:hypothetical protein
LWRGYLTRMRDDLSMAEPCLQKGSSLMPERQDSLAEEPAFSRWADANPLWRSLVMPPVGQRVLILDSLPKGVFGSLVGTGLEIRGGVDRVPGEGLYDLVLEEVPAAGLRPRRCPARSSLVAPGGRWVAVLQGTPAVGLHGRALLRRARSGDFEKVETFYAHPSLAAPKILVPLDRVEPIRYFLDFATGIPSFRKRCVAVAFPLLASLGIHRELLPNLILTARRKA